MDMRTTGCPRIIAIAFTAGLIGFAAVASAHKRQGARQAGHRRQACVAGHNGAMLDLPAQQGFSHLPDLRMDDQPVWPAVHGG
jgi:hypothetical protein